WAFSYMVATVIMGVAILGFWAYKLTYQHQHIAEAPSQSVPSNVRPKSVFVGRITGRVDAKWSDSVTGSVYTDGFTRLIPNTEQYDRIVDNEFRPVEKQPLSTFSIDVDTASYANMRRFISEGRLPPPDAVRIEEMVNYFTYDYPQPSGKTPFSVNMEVAQCPWKPGHRLLRIGLKGREIDRRELGPSNLVFLLDVSGSMNQPNKLPLVKQAMRMLVEQLTEDDRVAIVTYASGVGMPLPSARGNEQKHILNTIDSLEAGGSTHGSAGIELAYRQAAEHFVRKGINRVILCTDGDLNVGITNDDDLVRLIEEKAKSGVFLTVLGFGTGNLKDSKMEKLADHGNGLYAYIDSLREARRVLIEQMTGSLATIAKDVKLQIEFNPAEVAAYRLIGYENRVLANRDFDDDRKDAGEIGAGHTVTALYELVPADVGHADGTRPLKYQRVPKRNLTDVARGGELLTLRLRYKEPDENESKLLERTVRDSGAKFGRASDDFRFASAVAALGLVLRSSPYLGNATLAAVEEYAAGALGKDPNGYRAEFLDLVRWARGIQ
ncbi:MAG: VWA domain-containing protein, partial [Pirellulales bacterium]|nr:VWA domain-containing protein [Pirellulales bacterium]